MRAFITGGAGGLGRSLAGMLAAEGAQVLIGDVDVAAAEKTAAEFGIDAIRCDVRENQDLLQAAKWTEEHWGGVDLLINNAGVAHMGPLANARIEDWQWIVDINLLGVVRGIQAFLPLLRASKGTILNVASMSGLLFLPDTSAYNATKAGVVAISEGLMLELEEDEVDVHVVCPAFFRTELARGMRASDDDSEMMTRRLVERARLGPDDIARTILAKLSHGDRYIFTHPKSRRTWLYKRLLPFETYLNMMRKQLQQIRSRMQRRESDS